MLLDARDIPRHYVAAWLLTVLLTCGCQDKSGSPSSAATGTDEPETKAPGELLVRARQAYEQRDTYSDEATIHMSYAGGGQEREEQVAMRLFFRRPDQMRLMVGLGPTEVRLAGEGPRLLASVIDPATNNFDGQRVEHQLAGAPRVEDLYRATECMDPLQPGELTSLLLGLPLRLDLTPLGLLLGEAVWEEWTRSPQLRLLESESLQGRRCHRLQVQLAEGNLLFWFDAQSNMLRRIELPAQRIHEPDGSTTELRIVADFQPQMGKSSDTLPQLEEWLPGASQGLRHFVMPPMEQVSPLVGQQVPNYSFTTLQGEDEGSDTWNRSFHVLLWFQNDPTSLATLPLLEQVAQQFGEQPRVVFRAICTEPTTAMSHSDVGALAKQWGLNVPVLRDLNATGRDLFQIQQAPTLVVLDPQRRIHLYQVGGSAQLPALLSMVLHQLLAGEDLAQQTRERLASMEEAYRQQLVVASSQAPEAPDTTTAGPEPASEPNTLRLTSIWTCDELQDPGNLLVIGEGADARLWALDGWDEIVEMDLEGTVLNRRALPLDEDGAVTYLRTAVNGKGERFFVGTARMARACYVFDSHWELIYRYPASEQQHPGIGDVLLDDLDGDGELELYVGFQGIVGVHRVDATGTRQWSNRRLSNVLSLASGELAQGRQLLVTSDQGTIVAIDPSGQEFPPHVVAGHAIHQLAVGSHVAPDGTSQPTYCGLAYTLAGRFTALGLDGQLTTIWQQELPAGVYRNQLLFPVASQLGPKSTTYWWLVGPDGSLYVRPTGEGVQDDWKSGVIPSGLAAVRLGGRDVLILASPGKIQAWQVEGLDAE